MFYIGGFIKGWGRGARVAELSFRASESIARHAFFMGDLRPLRDP